MKFYKVYFKHTRTNGAYRYSETDWTLVESEDREEAIKDAREWVREYRSRKGYKSRVSILEVREIA